MYGVEPLHASHDRAKGFSKVMNRGNDTMKQNGSENQHKENVEDPDGGQSLARWQGRLTRGKKKQLSVHTAKNESLSVDLIKDERISPPTSRTKIGLLLSAAGSIEDIARLGQVCDLCDDDFNFEDETDTFEDFMVPIMKSKRFSITIDETAPDAVEASDSSSESDCDDSTVEEIIETKVKFGSVQIREYSLIVGDHPKASAYPVALDWKFVEHDSYDVDSFEANVRRRNWPQRGRAARRPPRLSSAKRFLKISKVSGKSHSDLYKLEQKRVMGIEEIPVTACNPDDFVDDVRRLPYEVAEVDDYSYQLVNI